MKPFHALVLSATFVAAAIFGSTANAAVITNGSSGIAASTYTIDFSGQAEDANITSAYAAQGITFNGLNATNVYSNRFVPTTAPAAINFGSNGTNPFGFTFAAAVTDVSFYLVTDGAGTTITSYLSGVEIESFTVGGYNGADSFQGFTNTLIDSVILSVSGDNAALIDNVSVSNGNNVPEPGSVALIGLGLAAAAVMRRRKA